MAKEKTAPLNPYDDRITINIAPPTEAEEEKGLFVSVNSYNAYIQYGVDVEVPRFVKEVLDNRKLALADKRKNEKKRRSKSE